MRKALKRILLAIGAVIMIGIVVIAGAFPFLAVTDPSGAKVAVVEGWIPSDRMTEVKAEIDKRGYERVYTTGTPRELSYTLRLHDTIAVFLREPMEGSLIVSACGTAGAGFRVIADADTVLVSDVDPECKEYTTTLKSKARRLWIVPTYSVPTNPQWDVLFTLYVKLNGTNVHELQRSIVIQRAGRGTEPGLPTFADAAADQLRKAGVPADMLQALPTTEVGTSRTWSNARRFAAQARQEGIDKVDVISFGIHARRSRVMYGSACGPDVEVGIISLNDPGMQRGRWWMHPTGWLKVLKELAGGPAGHLVGEGS